MAIRSVKLACSLTYDARKALETQTGVKIDYPSIVTSGRGTDAEVSLRMNGPHQEQLGLYFISEDTISHQGHVVAVEVEYGVRIMSDVWANLTYVVVYEPSREHTGIDSTETDWSAPREEGQPYAQKHRGPCGYFRRIQVGNSEFGHGWDTALLYEVDASQEILEVYEAHKRGHAFRQSLNEYDAREYRLACERASVGRDKWVRVTRGRKVEQGTEGLVFWVGESQWGNKVGIALPQADGTFCKVQKPGKYGNRVFDSYADVVFTYSKNVDVISGPGGRILRTDR